MTTRIISIGTKFGATGGRVPILALIIRVLQEEIYQLRKKLGVEAKPL